MRAGAYDTRIKLLKRFIELDQYGDQVVTYELLRQTRANVKDVSDFRESVNEVFYNYTKEFTMHRNMGIDEFDRIEYKGKQWRILSINDNRLMNHLVVKAELIND